MEEEEEEGGGGGRRRGEEEGGRRGGSFRRFVDKFLSIYYASVDRLKRCPAGPPGPSEAGPRHDNSSAAGVAG